MFPDVCPWNEGTCHLVVGLLINALSSLVMNVDIAVFSVLTIFFNGGVRSINVYVCVERGKTCLRFDS